MEKDNKNTPKDRLRDEEKTGSQKLPYNPDVTEEDKKILHERGQSMDTGRDEFLAERDEPVDFAADDLDIPGRDEADTSETGTDIPDEENRQFNRRGTRTEEEIKRDRENDLIDEDTEDNK